MRVAWLARWLFKHLRTVEDQRAPDITIGEDQPIPYMLRWYLIRQNRLCNVYLHKIIRSDDDRALHDHPWASLSLVLHGQMGELYRFEPPAEHERWRTYYRELETGSIVLRRAAFAHRLLVFRDDDAAWTLFITGPKTREWGFLCPAGWRHWKIFTAHAADGTSARIGRGCD